MRFSNEIFQFKDNILFQLLLMLFCNIFFFQLDKLSDFIIRMGASLFDLSVLI